MFKTYSMELAGRTLTVEIGRVAAQANGAAFMHYGDTVVLSTATASEEPRELSLIHILSMPTEPAHITMIYLKQERLKQHLVNMRLN